ncbi:hypothetical protein TNCV_1423661 [Trichonephila clavipes]|nr:hypothetical protein TNCV_1423661 [Trichonephila clavipes]
MSAADIHRYVTEVYGTEAMSDSKVRKWVKKFKDGSSDSLGGKRFSDNEEVKTAVNSWLSDQAAGLFEEGFLNLVLRCDSDSTSVLKIAFAYRDILCDEFKIPRLNKALKIEEWITTKLKIKGGVRELRATYHGQKRGCSGFCKVLGYRSLRLRH